MRWTRLPTDGLELLISEGETALTIVSLRVKSSVLASNRDESFFRVWEVREWIYERQEVDFSFEFSPPDNTYYLSSLKVVEIIGEHAAWAKSLVSSSLQRLRRLQ